MKNSLLILVFVLGIVKVGFVGCTSNTKSKNTEQATSLNHYHCPMGCEGEKTYDKPGKCPVCEMDLEKNK